MRIRLGALLAAGILSSTIAYSHHNATAQYQLDRTITVEGVVTGFWMINPHGQLQFDVATKSGQTQRWLAEGNSVGVLLRDGWKRDELKKGDVVKIFGRPSRDGSNRVLWSTITKSDGKVLYGGNSISTFSEEGVPEATRKQIDELRKKQIQEREQAKQKGQAKPAEQAPQEDKKQQPTQSY